MKKPIHYTSAILIVVLLLSACKKNDYLKGGTLHNAKVNMTTYDFLRSNERGLFDTLILLIDKAGIKDKINQQGITFFAPTDYAINNYLNSRAKEEQNINPLRKWTIDSMVTYELNKFKDSIDIYLVNSLLTYEKLTANGAIYNTLKPGAESVVSYEKTFDPALGYNPNVSTIPQLVWYTCLWQSLAPPFKASDLTPEQGTRVRVQTSGIETTNGLIHVLVNSHKLFFRK